MKKKWFFIAGGLVIVLLLSAAAYLYMTSSDDSVGTVANEKITKAEYTFFLTSVKRQMESRVGSTNEQDIKKFWATKMEGRDMVDVAKDQALTDAKEFKIRIIQAKESKIALAQEDLSPLDTQLEQMEKQLGDKVKVEEQVKQNFGVSLEEYKDIYKNYMLISKFLQEERKKIQVTDDEIKKYYEENKNSLGEVTVRHILVASSDTDPNEKKIEAKKKADDILAKVRSGGNFVELVNQFSDDPGSKETGGEYTFKKGKMVEEFEDWAFKAKTGDTGLVKTTYGYHIMKLEKAAAVSTFEEAKEALKNEIVEKKFEKVSEDQLNALTKDQKYNVIKNQKVFDSIKVIQ